MKIQRFTFLGLHGLADATYDLTDPSTGAPHDLVVITGPTASGKTRFLEALAATKEAIGPYGAGAPGASWLPPGESIAKVEISVYLDEEERAWLGLASTTTEGTVKFLVDRTESDSDYEIGSLFQRYSHAPTSGKVEYFPTNRRLPPFPPFHGLSTVEQRQYRCTKDPRKYSFVLRFLRELDDAPAAARAFADRLAALSPTCRYAPSGRAEGMPRSLSSRGGAPGLLTELSDGEADAVLFAATATALSLTRSIVLIDRPDLHTDAAQLPAFVAALRALGQNQLFLASGSPALLAAAAPALVIRLREG